MIGDTLTVTYNSVAKVLNKVIPSAGVAAEYMLRDSVEEFRIRIRHTNETAKVGQPAYERHQIDLIRTVFATVSTPERVYQAYTVIRLQKGSDPDQAEFLTSALCGVESASFIDKIVGWQA
jgi:hypothetical protein